ncbi:ankyrin repeat protein [Apiospora aurea]|uniref:Ankyrin repeat protein n=1 Tax=Apiospora aurea TaxID=335848 RepID=A0ABR1Q0C4_9PEZI
MANKILELPVELVLEAFGHLTDIDDLKSLACVTPSFYVLAIDRIWARADKDHRYRIFVWACASGSLRALRRLLDLGFTTNLNFQLKDDTNLEELTPEFYLRLPPNPSLAQAGWIDSYACIPYMDDYYDPAAPFSGRNNAQFWKPLHVAAHYGQSQITETLLQHGASIDATSMNYCKCTRPIFPDGAPKDLGQFTPLHVALCRGQEETAMALISHGATMYVDHHIYRSYRTCGFNRGRITALHLCASYGLLSTAKFIVEQGYCETGIDQLDEFGYSPLMYAYHFRSDDVFNYLLSQGANPQLTDTPTLTIFKPDARSILHQACHDARWEAVTRLVDQGSDPLELNGNGDPPMIIWIKSHLHEILYGQSRGESLFPTELNRMISTVEACGMHVNIPQEKLVAVAKYALRGSVAPLLSSLLDYGLDISTKVPAHEEDQWLHNWKYRWIEWDWDKCCNDGQAPEAELPGSHYNDTGRAKTQQTLLEYVCYHNKLSEDLEDVIELLLTRGCVKHGDAQPYVRAVKNLCYDLFSSLCFHQERDPATAADLFYVCLKASRPFVLDELLQVFDFHNVVYGEEALMHFFLTLVEDFDYGYDGSRRQRLSDLGLVFQADKSNFLLQHEHTFEKLCKFLLRHEGGEQAVLDYLDRGGRYCFTFEDDESSSALYKACATSSVQLAKRLLDMGGQTPTIWPRTKSDIFTGVVSECNPFRGGNTKFGIHSPFSVYLEGSDEEFGFYQELCQLAINDETNENDLVNIVGLVCARGKHAGIQKLRSRARNRVDTIIRDNAVPFLQKLLANLYVFDEDGDTDHESDDVFYRKYVSVEDMDEVIDTIRLLLELGPSDVLESRWRLEEPRIEGLTALRLLETLLTHPDNPHIDEYDRNHCDQLAVRYRGRIAWCLNERIKTESVHGRTAVTILGGEIAWPKDWYEPYARPENELDDAKRGYLQEIPMPWKCICELAENTRVRDIGYNWYWP